MERLENFCPTLNIAAMNEKLTVAGVQMDVAFADKETNLARIEDRLREAARHGARLVVFPECAVTGYQVFQASTWSNVLVAEWV